MSKGLEALETIKNIQVTIFGNSDLIESAYKEECDIIEKELKALDIIKKHFIIKLEENTELNGNVWGRLVSILSKEDEENWYTTACTNIVDYKEEFDLLKEVFCNDISNRS